MGNIQAEVAKPLNDTVVQGKLGSPKKRTECKKCNHLPVCDEDNQWTDGEDCAYYEPEEIGKGKPDSQAGYKETGTINADIEAFRKWWNDYTLTLPAQGRSMRLFDQAKDAWIAGVEWCDKQERL